MKRTPLENHRINQMLKISISVSAFRNQGKTGLIAAARKYISNNVDLRDFAKALNKGKYKDYLDETTKGLHRALKGKNCRWGTARKGLNIYFRDVFYSQFFYKSLKLKDRYGWDLEIPLDNKTMARIRMDLRELYPLVKLPKKVRIVQLTPEDSRQFQLAAHLIAKEKYQGYTRVDLDLIFWSEDL